MTALVDCLAKLSDDEHCAYEERAAIMEFDANMTREDAERLALDDVLRQRKSVAGVEQ